MSSAEYLKNLFGLEGKTAIVIGGTGVLGGAIAEALAGAGAFTYVSGLNGDRGAKALERIQNAGGEGEFFKLNATSRNQMEQFVDHLKDRGQQADILVNGAGINSPTPFFEIEDDEWEKIFNVNLNSVRIACQVFGQYMISQKTAGSIINIASLSAMIPLSRVFTYSATKAAVLNLTQNLAREWGTANIRVNALSPGFFPAEQNRKVLTADRVASIMRHTPMDRFGEPEELAGAVLLMASQQAGSFLTGANVVVDGGFTAMTI